MDIVDALGGITVDNPVAFTASDGSYDMYPAGSVDMDGAMALRFARANVTIYLVEIVIVVKIRCALSLV